VLSRRDLLRLAGITAGAGALAACTSSGGGGQPPSPGAPDDPDAALRAEVAAQETALLAQYAAAQSSMPAKLAPRLAELGRRHADYRAAVLPSAASGAASGSTSGATLSPSASSSPSGKPADVLASLRSAERQASVQRVAQAGRAHDPELARVLVLIAAGAAGASEVLARWTS
jgi:hypothetical protein